MVSFSFLLSMVNNWKSLSQYDSKIGSCLSLAWFYIQKSHLSLGLPSIILFKFFFNEVEKVLNCWIQCRILCEGVEIIVKDWVILNFAVSVLVAFLRLLENMVRVEGEWFVPFFFLDISLTSACFSFFFESILFLHSFSSDKSVQKQIWEQILPIRILLNILTLWLETQHIL